MEDPGTRPPVQSWHVENRESLGPKSAFTAQSNTQASGTLGCAQETKWP